MATGVEDTTKCLFPRIRRWFRSDIEQLSERTGIISKINQIILEKKCDDARDLMNELDQIGCF